jgi:hypothetical protein
MPDMTPMNMQKKGSATSVFQRIAEVALQDLVVFRNRFTTIICVKIIVETKHIEMSFVRMEKKSYFCIVNKTNSI